MAWCLAHTNDDTKPFWQLWTCLWIQVLTFKAGPVYWRECAVKPPD